MTLDRSSGIVRPMSPKQAAACCGPADGLLVPELFKALGDSTRVQILACLMKCGRACTVTEISECCDVDLSVVSRHLVVLARAGVLEARKQGREAKYEVRFVHLATLLRQLATAIEQCDPLSTEACSTGASGKGGCRCG